MHMDAREEKQQQWTALGVMFLLVLCALALRWYRLDLVSFRYDAAEAASRARETLKLGHPPLTGIVNSHGFRNAPAFIWIILPPFLFSPDIRWAVAWNGLLTASALVPLFLLSRRWMGGWYFLVPCVAYATMPVPVMQGRALWAQNLMPVLGAWCIWLLMHIADKSLAPRTRGRSLVMLTGLLLVAVSVHFSGAIWMALSAVAAGVMLRRNPVPRRYVLFAALCAMAVVATMIPSLLDMQYRRAHPLEKPPHVVRFEAMMSDPLPPVQRVKSAYLEYVAQLSSITAGAGIEYRISTSVIQVAGAADIAFLLLVVGGCAAGALMLSKRGAPDSQSSRSSGQSRIFIALLVAWGVVPPLVGALALQRVNGSYFVMGIPALLLLAALPLEQLGRAKWKGAHKLAMAGAASIVLAGVCWSAFILAGLRVVDQDRTVNGDYYIPLVDQEKAAKLLVDSGVAADGFIHLSGDWFKRPYVYLHEERFGGKAEVTDHETTHALMEDSLLRRSQPRREQEFMSHVDARVGTVGIRLFPSRDAGTTYLDNLWKLPAK